ncbi:hypothetical protein PsalN5692_03773 (plasmid) [Piscirickettsia salmonis]|uniref:type II toxin-antitoxin system RelE/ParE family toxin n=1 Tax=Piscirickettsia salmonis TaxID=1238 RepID=UPI000F091CDD|nr:type II toxin-antitoxin system RelE/ParE family toxin [Piscirickettsia salmonis]QGP52265.1 hypothetical protein PsalN5692_03773 [Piscirickettsia salmonis]RNC77320.1 addiction module toxin RelE [Piscirickettsiaceae bacterium NZ-RLO2]
MTQEQKIIIESTSQFDKVYKKLKANQVADFEEALEALIENPEIGEEKKGDLLGVRVYKFKMVKQQTLLAYYWEGKKLVLTLMKLGPHENFYRDLKKIKG